MRRDAIFYQLFKRFPALFFELVAIPAEQIRGYRFESVEVKEASFRIDGVFLPPEDQSPKIIFFVEVQFQKDQALYDRFFAELFLYLYRNPNQFDDWQGVLIFPSRRLEPDQQRLHRALLNSDQVQRLYLDEIATAGTKASIGVDLMRLTLEPEAQVIEQARQLIARARAETSENSQSLSAVEIIDIVITIAAYKFVSLSRLEVEAMLGVNLEETRLFQEIKEEGREEGREEGQLVAKLEMVPTLLELGLTVEQVAERLKLAVEIVQQRAAQP